jgi:hypothetical protein
VRIPALSMAGSELPTNSAASLAAIGAGTIRTQLGDYQVAFWNPV